jgi:hypothetical protein
MRTCITLLLLSFISVCGADRCDNVNIARTKNLDDFFNCPTKFKPDISKSTNPAYLATLDADRQGVFRYYNVLRRNMNMAMMSNAIASTLKIGSLFDTVPDIRVSVDVSTNCKVDTSAYLQFPAACPSNDWIVGATFDAASILPGPAGIAASIAKLGVDAVTERDIAASPCSEDFRDTRVHTKSTAECSSRADVTTSVDHSLPPANHMTYALVRELQQFQILLDQQLEIERDIAIYSRRAMNLFKRNEFELDRFKWSEWLRAFTVQFERSVAIRFFNSLFEIDRTYWFESPGGSGPDAFATCPEPSHVADKIERQMYTEACFLTYCQSFWKPLQSRQNSMIVRPREFVSHIPSYADKRWDNVREMFSDVFSPNFMLSKRPTPFIKDPHSKPYLIEPHYARPSCSIPVRGWWDFRDSLQNVIKICRNKGHDSILGCAKASRNYFRNRSLNNIMDMGCLTPIDPARSGNQISYDNMAYFASVETDEDLGYILNNLRYNNKTKAEKAWAPKCHS